MDRRAFLKATAAGVAASAGGIVGRARGGRPVAPSDRINVGIVGPGSRGQELMRYMLRVPGVKFVALADVWDARFAAARKITEEETPAFADYRRLLDLRDLDVIVVATPLYLHGEHMVAALRSGRHVYGEKSLGFTVDHCNRILAAARASAKQFQVGHQYRYAPWFQEAIKRVHAGEIGQVTHIHGYWHRNNNWRRPVPEPRLERLINWRMYREYSGGLMAELGSHQIDVANWVYGAPPKSVVASGGVDYYKDGRETNDNVEAVFRYPGGGTFVFTSITTNAIVGNRLVIYGTTGSVELTIEDATIFFEPTYPKGPTSGEIVERGVKTGATYGTKGEMPYRGTGTPVKVPEGADGNPNYLACASFFEAVRADAKPFADAQVGYDSATAVCLANKAIDTGTRMRFAGLARGAGR
jgi:predicted dehydrogenase